MKMKVSASISIIFINLVLQSSTQNISSLTKTVKEDIAFNNSNKGSLEVMKQVISQRIAKDPQNYSFDEILRSLRNVCVQWNNNSLWKCGDYKAFFIAEYQRNDKIKN
jgi:hypothetical protein